MTIPTAEIRPPINEYFEGDRIELECLTSGNPAPSITWQRASGRPLPEYAEVIEDLFIIDSAREEDSGEYRWGKDVKPLGGMVGNECLITGPPINEYFEGDRIELECLTIGHPAIHCNPLWWYTTKYDLILNSSILNTKDCEDGFLDARLFVPLSRKQIKQRNVYGCNVTKDTFYPGNIHAYDLAG